MSKSRAISGGLLAAAVAGLGYYGWNKYHGHEASAQGDAQKRTPVRTAVPVKIAPVEKADFPVYLTGLGTVQGFNTVVVRTRVDGQIKKIDCKEGEWVN